MVNFHEWSISLYMHPPELHVLYDLVKGAKILVLLMLVYWYDVSLDYAALL